jgi:hypothetical protein
MATKPNTPKQTQQKVVNFLRDGSVLDGTEYNGQVLIVSKTPEFMRDICPYLAPSFALLVTHIIYIQTGNLCFVLWIFYAGAPLNNYYG